MHTTFSVGNVLLTGLRIWSKNVIPFMVITLLICSPALIWAVSSVQGEMTDERIIGVIRALQYGGVLMMLLNIMVSAALTYGVVMELHGQRASIRACITTGLVRFFPVLGVAILGWLCILAGLICVLVPGFILYCMFYVATQCAVLERPGVVGALRRSRELTQGHKVEIFGLAFVLLIINFGLQRTIEGVTLSGADSIPGYVYVHLAAQMLVTSVTAVMASVAYYLLRAEKEGTSAAELAAVFD